MASPAGPAEMRAYIVERLVGEIGEPDHVMDAARALADRTLPELRAALSEGLGAALPITIASVELGRFADINELKDQRVALCIAASPSSPDALVLYADAACVAIALSVLFGGDANAPPSVPDRDFSPGETDVAALVLGIAAAAVNGTGSRGLGLKLPLATPMTGEVLRKFVVRDGPAMRVAFSIGHPDSGAQLTLMMPQRVLLKTRQAAGDAGEEPPQEGWRERFGAEIKRSAIMLEATMPIGTMTLGDVARLRIGQVVEFAENSHHKAKLSARDKTLFVCEFGKLGQNYTVRVSHAFDARQDLIEGLAP